MNRDTTARPWEWQKFGKDWYLTSQTRFRPIVISGKNLTNLTDGLLEPFDPQHPDSIYLETAVNCHDTLVKALESILFCVGDSPSKADVHDLAYTALKLAKGDVK